MRAEKETDGPIISRKDGGNTLARFCVGKGGGGGGAAGERGVGRTVMGGKETYG